MKKIVAIVVVASAVAGMSFAAGLTQLELADLLINKAVAEGLIENTDYSEDEIMDMVMKYDLMVVTDASAEMDVVEVRSILGDYDKNKLNIASDALTAEEKAAISYDEEYEALMKKDRKLSHEFMQMKSDNSRMYRDNLDIIDVEGNNFTYSDYDYPLINNYRYELYRIFGWYAKEYGLYVKKSSASVALYRRRSDYQLQSSPLIEVGFLQHPTDDNYDGVTYAVDIKVNALYFIEEIEGESLAEGRSRIESIGFKQAHLVMALKDASNVFIKNDEELNAFVNSFVDDVIENQDKEYSYVKARHKVFGDTRYFITKSQGKVFYYINHDLSIWED